VVPFRPMRTQASTIRLRVESPHRRRRFGRRTPFGTPAAARPANTPVSENLDSLFASKALILLVC